MITSNYFIIRPLEENDDNIVDVYDMGDKFIFFEIIDENGTQVDIYDNITISDNCRIDVMKYNGNWCTRVYGLTKRLAYDKATHEMKEEIENERKKENQ